ncbi:MAG: hypothetical protein WCH43_01995 [Verrucomicrobiota bacterium]
MSKSAKEQIDELRAVTDAKIEALRKQAIAELTQALKTAKAEIVRIEKDLSDLGALSSPASKVEAPTTRSKRLPKLEQGTDEWNRIADQIKIVLKRYPEGLNGKDIAKKLGKTEPNEIKRVITVVQGTCRREGEGVQTRFFVK